MSVWLTADDLAKTAPAERAALPSPVPTRVVSNGEFLPPPQTRGQRAVEAALAALADRHGRALGMSRRRFLRSSCGMAAAFLAMNQVYGALFGVDAAEAADPEAAAARRAGHARDFVLDAQLHFVRDDFTWPGILALGEFAKRWNPVLAAEGVTMHRYKFENFVKEVFLDSDTAIGILSAAPADDPANSILTNDQMAQARRIVNGLAGSRRLLCHAVFRPGQPGWLDELDRAASELKPDSWKGYTVGDPLAPSKWPWRLDDETAGLSRLRAHDEGGHADRLHPQGPDPSRLREELRALALRHGRRSGARRPRLARAHLRHLPLGPEAADDAARRIARAIRAERTDGLGHRPRRDSRPSRRAQRLRRARHQLRDLRRHAPAPRRRVARHLDQGHGRRARAVGNGLGLVRLAAVADRGVSAHRDPDRHAGASRIRAARAGERTGEAHDPRRQCRATLRSRARRHIPTSTTTGWVG